MEESLSSVYEAWHAIPDETIHEWISEKNITVRTKREFQGFEITESLDGRRDKNVEVCLVKLTGENLYPQHIHKNSDAYFIVVGGRAMFLSGRERREISAGERIDIPRGKPHGFELIGSGPFEFVSIQSPPIKDEHGNEDFEHFDLVDMV